METVLLSVVIAVSLCLGVFLWKRARKGSVDESSRERFRLELEALKVMGGALLLGGVIVTAFSYRLSREGQFTDRFTRAIEQLGSTSPEGKPNVEIRMGAAYALGRLASDSPKDRRTIIEILSTYVRQNSHWAGNVGPPSRRLQRTSSGGRSRNPPPRRYPSGT